MRATLPIILLSIVLAPAAAGIISTANFDTEAEALAGVVDGFFFVGHGDTELVRITRQTPPEVSDIPFNLWNNGQAHAFELTYDGAGLAAFAIDNVYRITTGIDVSFFNGLLVTAHADDPNTSVLVSNLVITDGNLVFYPTAATAFAAGPSDEDYLRILTDMNLAQKFILSGTATLTWPSAQPRPDLTHLWFEAAPVVIPEPAPAALLALAWLLVRPARPRR